MANIMYSKEWNNLVTEVYGLRKKRNIALGDSYSLVFNSFRDDENIEFYLPNVLYTDNDVFRLKIHNDENYSLYTILYENKDGELYKTKHDYIDVMTTVFCRAKISGENKHDCIVEMILYVMYEGFYDSILRK